MEYPHEELFAMDKFHRLKPTFEETNDSYTKSHVNVSEVTSSFFAEIKQEPTSSSDLLPASPFLRTLSRESLNFDIKP